MRVGDRHAAQPGPFSTLATVPAPMLRRGLRAGNSPLAVTLARASGEGSPEGAFLRKKVQVGPHSSPTRGLSWQWGPQQLQKAFEGLQLLGYKSLAT